MATKQDVTLLNLAGVATDANGTWFDCSEAEFPLSIQIVGSGASDAVIINTTGQYPLPANATHDTQQGSYTADAVVTIYGPIRGIKARKPAATQSSAVRFLFRATRS